MTTKKTPHHQLSIQNLSTQMGFVLPLTMLLLACLACNFPKLRIPAKASLADEGASTNLDSALAASNNNIPGLDSTSTSAVSQREVILHWQGALPGDPTTCHNLEVTSDHQASFGPCSEQPQVVPFNPPQWDEMLLRTAPFDISTPQAKVTFRGRGNTSGPAWERAVIRWAQAAYASLYTGRTACSTVLNWSFGAEPRASEAGICNNLWVTDYGYASVGEVPCQGGQTLVKASSWLETGELAQLDAWLMSRAEVHLGESGASYLLGSGSQAMSEEEITQLAAWSQQVKNRLSVAGQ